MKVKRYKLYQSSLMTSYDKALQIERDPDATAIVEELLEEHTGAIIHDFGSHRIFYFMAQKKKIKTERLWINQMSCH